jgi:hypothetical protein
MKAPGGISAAQSVFDCLSSFQRHHVLYRGSVQCKCNMFGGLDCVQFACLAVNAWTNRRAAGYNSAPTTSKAATHSLQQQYHTTAWYAPIRIPCVLTLPIVPVC